MDFASTLAAFCKRTGDIKKIELNLMAEHREPEIMHRMDLRGLDFLKILQMSLDRNYWALLAIGCDWAAEGWNPGVRWDECLMWTG